MTYKQEFIKFLVESEALLFGDFTLKSGRRAPYFINAGKFRTGSQIAKLGEYYAACYLDRGVSADVLVGPAYKGVPLAVATSIALYRRGVDLGYAFDRKEAKDHGEGGIFVGKQLEAGDRLCLVEDVMTSGKALREIMPKIAAEQPEAKVTDMLIMVDRQERGTYGKSAKDEAWEQFGVRVHSIVTVDDILSAIESGTIEGKTYLPAMREYRKTYGV